MILLDSNILIELSREANRGLRDWSGGYLSAVSGITYVEVLGYHALQEPARGFLEAYFGQTPILAVSAAVLDEAIRLRQIRKMSLGDALIAATALVHRLPLATRNVKDFRWIDGLSLLEPPGITPIA